MLDNTKLLCYNTEKIERNNVSMDENNTTNVELEEENLEANDTAPALDDFEKLVSEKMEKLRRQSLLLGAQSICRVILEKIYTHQTKPGKKTYRDYERLVKDIQNFCETGISRKISEDGEVVPKEEAKTESEQ